MDNHTQIAEIEPGLPLVGGHAEGRSAIERGTVYDLAHKFAMGTVRIPGSEAREDWVPASKKALAAGAPTSDGTQRLTVVSTHKPGGFQTRVFFVRHWIAPNGRQSGGHTVKSATLGAFKRLIASAQ